MTARRFRGFTLVELLVPLLLVGLSLSGTRSHAGDVDSTVWKRFLEGMAAAEQSVLTTGGRYKYVETVESSSLPNVREKLIDYAFMGSDCGKEVVQAKGVSRVSVRNPRYAFVLSRGVDTDSVSLTWLVESGVNLEDDNLVEDKAAEGHALALGASAWLYPQRSSSDAGRKKSLDSQATGGVK